MKKLALITGGTSGIGLAVAKSLSRNYDLALGYHSNHDKAAQAKKEILDISPHTHIELIPLPLMSYQDCELLRDKIATAFESPVSALIHCAGRIRDGLFLGSNFEDHIQLINEHLVVAMSLAHLFLKPMYQKKFGRIIFLSSISANYAKRGQANYAAAKAGIEGFTKTLALEVAHRGVTVNAIAPGLIKTAMTAEILEKMKEKPGLLKKRIPAARPGQPSDIGEFASFICGQNSSYMTGQVFTIDGGRSLGDTQS